MYVSHRDSNEMKSRGKTHRMPRIVVSTLSVNEPCISCVYHKETMYVPQRVFHVCTTKHHKETCMYHKETCMYHKETCMYHKETMYVPQRVFHVCTTKHVPQRDMYVPQRDFIHVWTTKRQQTKGEPLAFSPILCCLLG